jgi:hypothetical protein
MPPARASCTPSGRKASLMNKARFKRPQHIAALLIAVFALLMLFTQAFAETDTPNTTLPDGQTASQEDVAKAFRALQGVGTGVNNGEGGHVALQEACALLAPLGKATLDKLSRDTPLSAVGSPHAEVGRVCAQMGGSSGVTGNAVVEGMASDMLAGSLLPYAHKSGLPYLSHVEIEGGLIGGHAGSSITTVQPFYENRASGDFVFNQLSWQHQVGSTDDGTPDDTLNAGLAYRSLLLDEKLLVGSNVFFDHQLDQGHERMSVGVDARTSLYGFASNYYVPLTGWKGLTSLYEARAVSGMDMELSGQLEALPEWTLFVKGFTWDGGVKARTWGYDTNVEWSPVPALVFTTGFRDEIGSAPSVNALVRLRLNLGQSAAENFSPRKANLASVANQVWSKVRRENTIRTIQRKKASTGLQVLETSGANDADTDEGRLSLSAGLSFNMPATLHISDTVGAMARLQLADGGSLTLGQGTEARITPGLVTLVTGLAHYVSGSTDVTVDIPGGHIALLGTDIDVRSAGGVSTVRVRDGRVRLTGAASGSLDLTSLGMGQVTGGVASSVAEGSATYTTHADTVSTSMDWVSSGLTGAKIAPYLTAAPFIETNAHIPGETLRIALSFNAPVTVTGGTPSLSLRVGGYARAATLLSGSGSATLIFGYALQAADTGVSTVTVTDFNANGATISGDGKAAVIGIPETQLQLSGTVTDVTAPSGYAVAFTTSPITPANQTAAAFQITGAEVGATYNYTISSSGGGTNVTGSGTIATATQNVTGINVSGLGDGSLTVSLTQTDTASNTGSAATNTAVKDTAAPSGYAVAFTTDPVDAGNQSATSFQMTGAEVGATYNYTISSSGGGTPVTGSGTIATAMQNMTGINVSGLSDGTLTVSLTLTDAASNTGGAATDTVAKSITDPCSGSPSVGTVCADGTVYAGLSTDGYVPMYVTRCDLGQTWDGSACTGTRQTKTWNKGGDINDAIYEGYTSDLTGRANTTGLANLSDLESPHYAAQYCENLSQDGHSDWYLPARSELFILYGHRAAIGNLLTDGSRYWSSTEYNTENAIAVRMTGSWGSLAKTNSYYIRCARR